MYWFWATFLAVLVTFPCAKWGATAAQGKCRRKGTSCCRPCKPDIYGHYSFHLGRAATDVVEEGLVQKRARDDTGSQALQMHEEGRRGFCRKTV